MGSQASNGSDTASIAATNLSQVLPTQLPEQRFREQGLPPDVGALLPPTSGSIVPQGDPGMAIQHTGILIDPGRDAETTNSVSAGLESSCSQRSSDTCQDDKMVVDSASTTSASHEEMQHSANDDNSVPSDVGTLRHDLECALGGQFDFKGSHAYGAQASNAPNPCLHIRGLGLLGLPLSERDAKLIIDCAGQSSCARDYQGSPFWEIEASRITFANPAWSDFVSSEAKLVCQELGVMQYANSPCCTLHSLCLHPPGSWFSPKTETDESNGVFGTITIILPSSFTGGQVCLTQDGSTKVFDFAPHSILTTNVVSWYSGVIREVKAITSGYQLTLMYKLVHALPGIPRPTLPNINAAVGELHSILRKWFMGQYLDGTDINFMVYLLKHDYTDNERETGTLKGEDALKAFHLRAVAQQLGYVVGLASLRYQESGIADFQGRCSRHGASQGEQVGNASGDETEGEDEDENDDNDNDNDENRDEDDDEGKGEDDDEENEDDGNPSMSRITETQITVNQLTDFDGVQIIGNEELFLDKNQLIPKDPFVKFSPDEMKYEGSNLDYYYYRTALVIFHKNKLQDILLFAGGVPYAQKCITDNASQGMSTENLMMVEYILDVADENVEEDANALRVVADCALRWKDFEIWRRAVETTSAKSVHLFGEEHILAACRIFSFASVQPTFEKILMSMTTFASKIKLLQSWRRQLSDEDSSEWSKEQIFAILKFIETPPTGYIDILVSLVLSEGLSIVDEIILPHWGNAPSSFKFWSCMINALYKNKATLVRPNAPACTGGETSPSPSDGMDDEAGQENDEVSFADIMTQCFNAAIRQWDRAPLLSTQPSTSHAHGYTGGPADEIDARQPVVTRVIELMELCITTHNLAALTRLILVIVRCKGAPVHNFRTLYHPLIPLLCQLLKKYQLDVCSPPFGDFMRILIGMYLSTVLGAKPRGARVDIRKIGCGCGDCSALDDFVGSKNTRIDFRFGQNRRKHLEQRANRATDLISVTTAAYSLVVTKRPEVLARIQWTEKQEKAKQFLSSIGKDDVIAKLMGARYQDVNKALEGTLYVTKLPTPPSQSTDASNVQTANLPTVQSQGESTQTSITPISMVDDVDPATGKRKRSDETTIAVATPPNAAKATSRIHDIPTTGPGSNTMNTSQPSALPAVAASVDVKHIISTNVPPTNQIPVRPRLSPRKPKPVNHEVEHRPKLVTHGDKVASSSQSAGGSSQRSNTRTVSASTSTPVRVKIERLDSALTQKKRKIESYNFIGPVIDISDDE